MIISTEATVTEAVSAEVRLVSVFPLHIRREYRDSGVGSDL